MERLRSLPNPLSLRLPKYPIVISCYCTAHSVTATLVYPPVTGHLTFQTETCEKAHTPHRSVLYLCVGLVVLAVVGGGIAAVRSCGCSRGGVREGAGVLGDDGSD